MKVKIDSPGVGVTTLFEMPVGSLALRLEDGAVFFRTMETATCLTTPDGTFSRVSIYHTRDEHRVILLPPGSVVTLTVDAPGHQDAEPDQDEE